MDSQPQGQPHDPLTHYVIVRSDLPKGLLAAQIAHAAGESSPGGLPEGTHAVVLAVEGPKDLEDLSRRFTLAQVPHKLIVERDPPYTGNAMAVGLAPNFKSLLKRHVSFLPLLK